MGVCVPSIFLSFIWCTFAIFNNLASVQFIPWRRVIISATVGAFGIFQTVQMLRNEFVASAQCVFNFSVNWIVLILLFALFFSLFVSLSLTLSIFFLIFLPSLSSLPFLTLYFSCWKRFNVYASFIFQASARLSVFQRRYVDRSEQELVPPIWNVKGSW